MKGWSLECVLKWPKTAKILVQRFWTTVILNPKSKGSVFFTKLTDIKEIHDENIRYQIEIKRKTKHTHYDKYLGPKWPLSINSMNMIIL